MTRSTPILLAPLALSLLLAACATKPKAGPVAGTTGGAMAQGAPRTDLPPGGSGPGGAGGVSRTLQEELAATAGDRVYFAFDSATVDEEAKVVLRQQAAWLRSHPEVRARIAGNADERGTREYNLALGARRAEAARQGLIASGVASTRLETISYGKERPLEPGSTEEAWARNRNAQTVVIDLESP